MGCSAMLLSPILVVGAILLASASEDSGISTFEIVTFYLFLSLALLSFVGRCIVWILHR
jgi:hypothetical protein